MYGNDSVVATGRFDQFRISGLPAQGGSGSGTKGLLTGQASTGINRPRVKNPTAKWAIGDTLITTGESVATDASFHRRAIRPPGAGCEQVATFRGVSPPGTHTESRGRTRAADLTVELCEGYRRTLWKPPESPGCS
jgi:hypothetical protein